MSKARRRALVAAGTGGIGAATAAALVSRGHRVIVTGTTESAHETASAPGAKGAVVADFSQPGGRHEGCTRGRVAARGHRHPRGRQRPHSVCRLRRAVRSGLGCRVPDASGQRHRAHLRGSAFDDRPRMGAPGLHHLYRPAQAAAGAAPVERHEGRSPQPREVRRGGGRGQRSHRECRRACVDRHPTDASSRKHRTTPAVRSATPPDVSRGAARVGPRGGIRRRMAVRRRLGVRDGDDRPGRWRIPADLTAGGKESLDEQLR